MLPSTFFILLIRFYKLTLSPLIAFLAGPSGACRFEPSCSQYAIEALKTHGTFTGGWLATKRICRCHPLSDECGDDPVPSKSKLNLTSDPITDHQISPGITNFLPVPKGEGEGDTLNVKALKAFTGKSLRRSTFDVRRAAFDVPQFMGHQNIPTASSDHPLFLAPRLPSIALAKEDRL